MARSSRDNFGPAGRPAPPRGRARRARASGRYPIQPSALRPPGSRTNHRSTKTLFIAEALGAAIWTAAAAESPTADDGADSLLDGRRSLQLPSRGAIGRQPPCGLLHARTRFWGPQGRALRPDVG